MAQSLTLGPIYNQQNDKIREWSITIDLFDSNHRHKSIASVDMQVPEGATAEYYTISGYQNMKMTESAPTKIIIGKNLGKSNETNVLTQAYNECKSKYTKKIKSGYTEKVSQQNKKEEDGEFPYPMNLKLWDDFKEKLKYPLYVQPKLDGLRMIAMLDSKGIIQLKTRTLEDVPGFEHLRQELTKLYASGDKSLILDGELYSHGMNLQDISGIVRNESSRDDEKNKLQYWLFDAFSLTRPNEPFEDRTERLREFVDGEKSKLIILDETIKVDSDADADKYYHKMVRDGYEGIIYKSMGKPYAYSFHKAKRSQWYLKRKQFFDDEFEIIGFTHGRGKDHDSVKFVFKTKKGVEFTSVPNGTYEYKKDLYKRCLKDFSQFEGQFATIKYEKLSTKGVPQANHMIAFRDLNFD